MKTPAIVLIGIAAMLFLTAAGSQEKANPRLAEIDELVKKTSELQRERIATLKETVDLSVNLAKLGRSNFEDVLEAQASLLNAELDAAEKESDRIAYCQKALETLKEAEQTATARKASARGTGLDVLKIKARRLEIEILLEQAKLREAKASK